MEIKRDILWRVYLSFIGIVLLSFVVLGRAFYIQKVEGAYWRSMSDSLHQKFINIDAERGTIFSEDGEMLSTSIPYFDIYMDFAAEGLRDKKNARFRENIDSFSYAMAYYFNDKSAAEYKRELKEAFNERNRYYLLRKNLSFKDYQAFRNFPLARLGRNKSGIIVETKSKRLNPYGILARRTIGLSRENAQNVGLERTYDNMLKGATGKRLVRFIAGGAYVPVEGYEIEPENGKDVITTLDVNIQDIAENALMKMMVKSGSQYGTCVVMETKTGKIKAIANLGLGKNGYDEDLNYALRTTEPGSTIKLATLMAVLDAGYAKITDHVDVGTAGHAFVGVRNVNDAEKSPKAVMTVKESFAHSSNIAMSKLAYGAFAGNPSAFKNYLLKFRLHEKSGVALIGEEAPVLPKLKKNNEGIHAMLTASFGYAIEISPIQTLALYNAIANNGRMMQPYLVNAIKSNGEIIEEYTPKVLIENISRPQVIKDARACLEAVVTEGTAKAVFQNTPFRVAGKTGTAHVAGGNIKYSDGVYQASFAGYFPADDPMYTCIVLIRTQPHAIEHFGGQLAAPVFREIAEKLFAQNVPGSPRNQSLLVKDSIQSYYSGSSSSVKNILSTLEYKVPASPAVKNWAVVTSSGNQLKVQQADINKKVVPDVRNMNLRDALYLLENMNLKVVTRGRGKVIMQDIEPGTALNNQTITLLLN